MRRILLLVWCFPALTSVAQNPADSIKLPFAIAKEKRLSDEDLKNKKEGTYVTGIPDLSSDPVNGFGYGGEGSVFFDGKKSDPFFAYTPYRAKLDLVLFNTTRKQRELIVKLDVPYIFNTKWRLRMEAGYEGNPNLLYFGKTEKSLQGLSYYPHGDSTEQPVTNARYADYEKNLGDNNQFYNRYIKNEYIFNASIERSFMDGKLRTLVGYEIAYVDISTFKGNSMLQNENRLSPVLGLGKSVVGIEQLGLIYDTRDLETDPNQGIFAELTNELSLKTLGSAYNFNKTFFHANLYRRLLPKNFKKFILAGRVAMGYTASDAPFFEYQDQWSSEGSIEGLGGAFTIRGYKQARFMSRVMSFNNLEARYRFAETTIAKQHLAFSAVPFADAGGVWDNFSRLNKLSNWRTCEGLGVRLAWNVNTILRLDYAISKEDRQLFFNFGHTF